MGFFFLVDKPLKDLSGPQIVNFSVSGFDLGERG